MQYLNEIRTVRVRYAQLKIAIFTCVDTSQHASVQEYKKKTLQQ